MKKQDSFQDLKRRTSTEGKRRAAAPPDASNSAEVDAFSEPVADPSVPLARVTSVAKVAGTWSDSRLRLPANAKAELGSNLSSIDANKPSKIASKPALDGATPGWAHPSQALPSVFYEPPKKKDALAREQSTQQLLLSKTTSANASAVDNATPGWAHPSQAQPHVFYEPPKKKDAVAKEQSNQQLSSGISRVSQKVVSHIEMTSKPGAEQNGSGANLTRPPNVKSGSDRSVVGDRDRGPKAQVDTPTEEKKKSAKPAGDVKVTLTAETSKEESVVEPKKKNFMAERKRRHTKKSRKSEKVTEKPVPTDTGDSVGDMSVAHPDFLDESFLKVVDAESRRESRRSSEFNSEGVRPLRLATHKKRNTSAFKDRVHNRRSKRRGKAQGGYDWEETKRLPDDVVPFQYTLYLEPHIESNILFGRVNIAIDLVLPKSQLWLHARNLHITSTQVFDQNDNQIPILGAHKYRKNEFFVIFLEGNLRPGIYMINMDYNCILSDRSSIGAFVRSYKLRDGSNRHLVYSQLDPVYARRVFPCFDEPTFKATYDISIVRPTNDYIVLSNMTQESEEEDMPQRGYTTVNFHTTPPIAPFQFFLVMCDFTRFPITDERLSFPLNFYARDDKIEYKKAADIFVEAIAWFQDYFKIPFTLPKLDVFLIPDMKPISIEGFGTFAIQEDLLKMKDDYEYETLHFTIARGAVSQWIGSDATVSWWNDLWYKEGLTIMLANLFLDDKYPEQQAIPNFICYLLQPCMYNDVLINTKKIDRNITDPNDIAEYMDPIAFTKAAAVFRMIEQMESNAFAEGLNLFLAKFHFANASWKDLADCLHIAGEKSPTYLLSVENMIYSWSQYPGYPLVVTARGQKAIAMTHRRFFASVDAKTIDPSHFPTWEFPITFIHSYLPEEVHLMYMKADTIDSEVRSMIPDGVVWYKVNVRQTGFFRVVYPDDEWNNIKKVLLNRPHFFTPEDRANILDDMFSLSRAGCLCYGRTFSTLTYLRYGKENSWLPWACVLKHLVFIKNALSSNATDSKNFESYMAYIIDPILTDEVWNITDKDDKTTRWKLAVIRLACTMEIPSARSRMSYLFQMWGFNGKKPKPEILRFLIVRYGATDAGYTDEEWLALWKMFQHEKNVMEKNKLLACLASVAKDTQKQSLLITIKSGDDKVNDHGFFTVLYEMATTRHGATVVWNFIKSNWSYLTERFASSDSRLFLLFPHMAQSFFEEQLADELNTFSKSEVPTLSSAIAVVTNTLYWTKRYKQPVTSWLSNVQRVLNPLHAAKSSGLHRAEKSFVDERIISGSKIRVAQ